MSVWLKESASMQAITSPMKFPRSPFKDDLIPRSTLVGCTSLGTEMALQQPRHVIRGTQTDPEILIFEYHPNSNQLAALRLGFCLSITLMFEKLILACFGGFLLMNATFFCDFNS